MKKIIYILFTILISMCCAFVFAGCNSNSTTDNDNAKAEVVLNAYMLELNVGDTFEFSVKKFIDGVETSVKDLQLKSDVKEIVSISNNKITALNIGTTYIHFNVDGVKTACYLTVLENKASNIQETRICFSSKNLYNGLNSQALAYVYDSGNYIVPENIVWGVEGEGSIDENGVVTPNDTQTQLVVKANFVYENKSYAISQTVNVLPPIYCVPTTNTVKLMVDKTPTGILVNGLNSSIISFNFVNFITNTEENVQNVSFTYRISNDLVQVETIDAKTAKIIGKIPGVSTIEFYVNGFNVFVDCKVSIPISTAEEFLSLQSTKLESSDAYALVNDIKIKVNGTYNITPGEDNYDPSKGVELGSDACWKKDTNGTYSLMSSFSASLDGNGYKVIIDNTTPFAPPSRSSFAGVFNNVKAGAVIENVVFDIQIKKGNFIPESFSSLVYKLEGTLSNCYIRTTVNGDGVGENSAVIRTITTTATLSNNIYEMDGKLATVSRDIKYAKYDEKQIIIGANKGMFTVVDERFHAKLDNVIYYNSIADLLNASNYGKSHVVLYKVNTSAGGHDAVEATGSRANYYHPEGLTDRLVKLELDDNWAFDYENGVLKLCNRVVIDI